MKKISLKKLHKLYIKETEEKTPIILHTTLLCNLPNAVIKAINLRTSKVHITTRVLKHLYDSKPAEEYEFILNHLISIVMYPNQIYENRDGKRGGYAFVKSIKKIDYFCSFEINSNTEEEKIEEMNFVVTAFRIRKKNYLKNYKLLWSWKDDNPSS